MTMNWDTAEYQRISSAERRGDEIVVLFEDGSRVTLPQAKLTAPRPAQVDVNRLTVNPHELVFHFTDGHETEVPWTTIRSLTDKEFNRHLVRAAEEEARQIGLRIKELREAKGMSSKDLAERAGLTPQSVSRIENGRHDVVFTSLRKILAAMNCTLGDLSISTRQPTTWEEFTHRLERLGFPLEFVRERFASLGDDDAPIADTATRLSRVYGWSVRSILDGLPLSFDLSTLGAIRFKRFGRKSEIRAKAYTLFAHWLAIKAIEATPDVVSRPFPTDAKELRKEVLNEQGDLTLASCISYVWQRGCVVVPLSDSGAFHGACWKIGDRTAIVLKQKTPSLARWLYDLIHEIGHVAKHITDETPTVIESEEISPLSKDEEEVEANDFAEEVLFEGMAEELVDNCVSVAKGDLRRLKAAVAQVSRDKHVPVDLLANYMAYRLSEQGENWWGAANNLQVCEPSPLNVAQDEFKKRVNLDILDDQDRRIIIKALS